MTATTSLFNISKPKAKAVASYDYQNELSVLWLGHLDTDRSGILEDSINHGDGCKCCTGCRRGV
jgi:hypothetical protein